MYVKSFVEVARMLIARSGKLPFCAGARAPISENSETNCAHDNWCQKREFHLEISTTRMKREESWMLAKQHIQQKWISSKQIC